jgi:hypothetical protein
MFNKTRSWFTSIEELRNSTVNRIEFDAVSPFTITELPPSVTEIHFSHSPDIVFECDCGAIEKVSCSGETKFDDRNYTNLQEFTAFSEFNDYPDPCLIKEGNISINNLRESLLISCEPRSFPVLLLVIVLLASCDSASCK